MAFVQLLERKQALQCALLVVDSSINEYVTTALETFRKDGPYTPQEALRIAGIVSETKDIKLDLALRPVLHKFSVLELEALFALDRDNESFSNSLDNLLAPTIESLAEMSPEQLEVVDGNVDRRELEDVLSCSSLPYRSCMPFIVKSIAEHKRKAAEEQGSGKRTKI
jgi:hypothetical protein